ncbi:MAG: hypothetical protein KJ077_12395 [Anaerolineae bacterium]|nr:hypothetical protein [Anaerolineae bacterium]
MTTKPDKLTAKHYKALAALLNSTTLTSAAKVCGLSERTLQRYLELPAFKQALAEAEAAAMSEAARLLARVSTSAVAVLASVMGDASQPGAVRLNAAKSLLSVAIAFRGHVDLETRLAQLEATIKNSE